jgi:hypothetical protein
MTAMEELQKTVLSLPVEQRALLAESLLVSIPPVEEAWTESEELAEVERRQKELDSGQVKAIDEKEFWDRVQASRRR